MPKTAEDYAREMIGSQAMQIIGLRAQLDAAQAQIQKLEKALFEAKGGHEPLRAVERAAVERTTETG